MQKLEELLKQNPKKHLIFDYDETLYWLHLPWSIYKENMTNLLSEYNEQMVKEYGIGSTFFLANKMITMYGKELRDRVIKVAEEFESGNLEGLSENTELVEFIKNNSDKYTFHLWTSNTTASIVDLLERTGVKDYFDKIVTKSDVDLVKDAPDGFYKIFEPENYSRNDYLMIGNSEHDEGAAENARIDFFFVDASKVEWERVI